MPPRQDTGKASEACTDKSPARQKAGQTFPLFVNFPPEIRAKIWSECIPHQFIVVNRGDFPKAVFLSQRRPPVISRVCHEAREVALRSGSQIELGVWKEYPWDNNSFRLPTTFARFNRHFRDIDKAWFDPKRDTFVLRAPPREDQKEFRGFPSKWEMALGFQPTHDWIGLLQASNRIAFSSLCVYESFGMEKSPPCSISAANTDKDSRIYNPTGMVVIMQGLLADAIDTGLFGLFGDKTVLMVDYHDTETFRTLRRISRGPCDQLLDRRASVGDQSSKYSNEANFDPEANLRTEYLKAVFKADNHRPGDGCEWHSLGQGLRSDSDFDYDHPSVQEILNKMPAMRIAVLVLFKPLHTPQEALEASSFDARESIATASHRSVMREMTF